METARAAVDPVTGWSKPVTVDDVARLLSDADQCHAPSTLNGTLLSVDGAEYYAASSTLTTAQRESIRRAMRMLANVGRVEIGYVHRLRTIGKPWFETRFVAHPHHDVEIEAVPVWDTNARDCRAVQMPRPPNQLRAESLLYGNPARAVHPLRLMREAL